MKARELFCLGLGVAVYAGDKMREKLAPLSPCARERGQELRETFKVIHQRRVELCKSTAKRFGQFLGECLTEGVQTAREDAKAVSKLMAKD